MALHGLPPLPKSLSVLVNADHHRARSAGSPHGAAVTASPNFATTNRTRDLIAHHNFHQQKQQPPQYGFSSQSPSERHPHQSRMLADVGNRDMTPPRPSRTSLSSGLKPAPCPAPMLPAKPPQEGRKFDSQMGHLRREMDGLRQMDLSLLYQLWSLNESIQEYKQIVEERAWDADVLYSDATMDEIYERGPPCGNNDSYRVHSSRDASSTRLFESHYENSSSASSLDYSSFMK